MSAPLKAAPTANYEAAVNAGPLKAQPTANYDAASKGADKKKEAMLTDLDRNGQLLNELNHLVMKQQLLISKAFQGSLEERQRTGGQMRVQQRLRYKGVLPDGCRVRIWKQDPSVSAVGVRNVFLPNSVKDGPRDELISVRVADDQKIKTGVKVDSNGDLLVDETKDILSFDLVQAYSVVRLVCNMYERDLNKPLRWQWDHGVPLDKRTPIEVICHAGEQKNAAYVRSKKLMKFYYFTDSQTKKEVYLCRSLDIVAHETGHAIMDALKPKLYDVKEGQSGALHEAFADCTALFTVLSQLDLCEHIVATTKGHLRNSQYLSSIGEEFGNSMNSSDPATIKGDATELGEAHNSVGRGVRNLNNEHRASEAKDSDVYKLALTFSGFVFDILVAAFEEARNPFAYDDAETLFKVARILRRTFLLSVANSPEIPTFTEIAVHMEKVVDVVAADDDIDVPFWKELIRAKRLSREFDRKHGGDVLSDY